MRAVRKLIERKMRMRVVLLAFLPVLSTGAVAQPVDDNELELVQILFRHGERTPLESETYPRDPYSSSSYYEPWGRGRLTDLGRYRMRRLGQALQRRYARFLGTLSGPGDVYAHSLDSESCLASLRLLIDFLGISRVPVAIRSRDTDVLGESRTCSRLEAELKAVRRSPEVLKMMAKYEGLYRRDTGAIRSLRQFGQFCQMKLASCSYVMEKTGLTFDGVAKDQRLYQLYNLLEAQRSMNLSLPDWCPEGVLRLLSEIAYLHFNFESYNQELRRLNGGPLVRRFLESMMPTRSRKNAKFHLYSAEDQNVAAFTRAIDRRFPRVPNYASAIIVEKHRRAKSTRTLARTMIWTGVTEKLFPLRLNGCAEVCPLEDYARIVAKSLPSDEDLQCLFNGSRELKYLKFR